MKKWLLAAGVMALLAACSAEEPAENTGSVEDGNNTNTNEAIGHGVEDGAVGFTLDENGVPVEAANVPEEEKEAIFAAYDEYIAAFNAEDIERYMKVIAEEPDGFDREEDRAALESTFGHYNTTYTPSNMTIVNYEENRAEVFATIDVSMTADGTSSSVEQSGRQVVVFKKEQDGWKVSALHFIGNQ